MSALRFFLYLVYIESALIYAYKLYKHALFVTLICGMLVDILIIRWLRNLIYQSRNLIKLFSRKGREDS